MGDVGDNPHEIEVLPITQPVREPIAPPAPAPARPATPAPAEPVPA